MNQSNPFSKTGYIIAPPSGQRQLLRKRITWQPQETDVFHLVAPTDVLEAIAHQHYSPYRENGGGYWWLIADANLIQNPLDLTAWVGKPLRIPDIRLLDFVVKR